MALPHRIVENVLDGLKQLDNVIPGVNSDSTLLYAPEIKFYSMRFIVNKDLETNLPNFFVAGMVLAYLAVLLLVLQQALLQLTGL